MNLHVGFSKSRILLALIALLATTHVAIGQKPQFSDIRSSSDKNIRKIKCDLIVPSMVDAKPAAGKRVKIQLAAFQNTNVYHSLYLPKDWQPGKRYPVIVEYAGNGTYSNNLGDVCNGLLEECNLGYGLSGGEGFIWICLPFVSKGKKQNQLLWWGDVESTVDYCKSAVENVCSTFGGDRRHVFLAGFSRGSIACNYIGLHDEQIAKLWCGFICHSHYDGTANWGQGDEAKKAAGRLARLGNRPQFISHEEAASTTIQKTQTHLKMAFPKGKFTFVKIPYPNHTDTWVLRDIPERKLLRDWIQKTIADSK